jgi:uncharacterized peroxidase-related enzyme
LARESYDISGSRELLQGRGVVVITARGESYRPGTRRASGDFQEPYLREIFQSIGPLDVTFVHAEYQPRSALAEPSRTAARQRVAELLPHTSSRRRHTMAMLKPIEPAQVKGRTKELFESLERALHRVPNMMRLMANSPAIFDTYLNFNRALEQTRLSAETRALITVAVAEINGCDYTLSLGMAIAKSQGISEDDLNAARVGRARDAKIAATLQFATSIVRRAGRVPHAELERLRDHGFTDEEIVEVVAAVALNIFRNYFNLVVSTEIDSPLVISHHGP